MIDVSWINGPIAVEIYNSRTHEILQLSLDEVPVLQELLSIYDETYSNVDN